MNLKSIQGSQEPWTCVSTRGYQRLYTTNMSLHYSHNEHKGGPSAQNRQEQGPPGGEILVIVGNTRNYW